MKKKFTVSLFLVISALAFIIPANRVFAFGNPYGFNGNYFYNPAPTTTKKAQFILAYNKIITVDCKPISLGAITNGDGKLTYSSSSSSVAKVSSKGIITPKSCGITTITIKAAETDSFTETSAKITVTVLPKTMKVNSVKSTKKKREVFLYSRIVKTRVKRLYCQEPFLKNSTACRSFRQNDWQKRQF